MKKVNLFSLLMTAALVVGTTSCSNDDDVMVIDTPKGERTSMQFVINAPKAPATYAVVDNNATQDEIDLKTVGVLVYEQTGTGFILENVASLTMSDFDLVTGSDKYALKNASKISTTTGAKKIFVAMNYSGSFPEVGSSIAAVSQLKAELTTANDLSNASSGFAMFSTDATDATLVTEDDTNYGTANNVLVTVKRLVAKISVQEHAGLRTDGDIESQGGWLTNLKFAAGNINKTSYLLQNVVGTAPNRVVQDFNWTTYSATDFFAINDLTLASALYKTVDASGATIANGTINPVYVTENTTETYNEDGDNLTYVSVRAQYVPEFFCNANGVSKGPNNSTTSPVAFWTVILSDGVVFYFDVEADATTFAAANAGSAKSDKYVDGLCYWRGYLNQSGAADATISGSIAAKFDVLRNVYYKAVIKSIKAPGEATDKGKVTEDTSLVLEVEVAPWETHEDDWNL